MGEDKGTIVYHDRPQREYLFDLLSQICTCTYYSVREDQDASLPAGADFITDKDRYKGPYNGLLSAFDTHPEVAWLVLACDLPLMNLPALKHLMRERDQSKLATSFSTQESGLPEPLAAIWEPAGLQQSLEYLSRGTGTCPRKFLINARVKLVVPDDESVLINANSREDYEKVLLKLEDK
jgi:molybdopterin-guanine dinucleotide biosynthesis protein A